MIASKVLPRLPLFGKATTAGTFVHLVASDQLPVPPNHVEVSSAPRALGKFARHAGTVAATSNRLSLPTEPLRSGSRVPLHTTLRVIIRLSHVQCGTAIVASH